MAGAVEEHVEGILERGVVAAAELVMTAGNCGTKNRRSQLWAVTKPDLAGYSQIIPGRRQKRPKIQS